MGYVLKAVLSSAQHPEYGQITVPFPIPDEKYDRMIELLEPLEIGDALRQDCRVDELDSFYILRKQKITVSVYAVLPFPASIRGTSIAMIFASRRCTDRNTLWWVG